MQNLIYKLQIETDSGETLLTIEAPTEELLLEKLGAFEREQNRQRYVEEVKIADLPF